jgi:pilus assembly protein CpaF
VGLYERLAQAREIEGERADGSKVPSAISPAGRRSVGQRAVDPLDEIKSKIHAELLAQMGPRLYDTDVTPEQMESRVREKLGEVLQQEQTPLSTADRQRLVVETIDNILGFGPIEPLLADVTVTEVMCNGPDDVYVERDGKITKTDVRFLDEGHLRRTIDKIVGQVGRRIDESSPYVDARLPDGSRVNAIVPPVSIDGPVLTVRKFARDPFVAEDLVVLGTMTSHVARFLDAAVRGRMNVLVSGGTGAGKTTSLNVLSSFIPSDQRIVTVEDSAELQLQQPHVVRLEYRPPNIEGRGEVKIRDLVRNALRMRPDRIVVGEVRGEEALDMLQAMNTGHDGSITTVHANSPRDVLARLETMVLMAGMDLPLRAIREQIAAGIQLIVHQGRLIDGSRRFTHVTEVTGMEGDTITLQDLFLFDHSMGYDDNGRALGMLKPTGIRPQLSDRLRAQGVELESEWFAPEELERAGRR